jgi:F-type H+-transporting ATPase subunit delta
LALEGGRVEAWSQALGVLAEVLESAPELAVALGDRVRSREERRALVEQLIGALSLDREPANLLLLLGDRNRLDRLGDVLRAFGELSDAHLGRLRARVTSAVPLEREVVAAIAERLSRMTHATVLVEGTVEPAILGGVIAQVGSLVYDGSVRTQLDGLRKSLKG